MINLVKNELIKICRKKSTIICLLVIIGFMIFINYIMSSETYTTYDEYEVTTEQITIQENYISSIDDALVEELANAKMELLILELRNKNDDSWVYEYLETNKTVIEEYYLALLTNEDYSELELVVENIKENVENNNWEDYVNNIIEENNLMIENFSTEEIYSEELIEYYEYINSLYRYRIENNVDYSEGYLNDALNTLIKLKTWELSDSTDYSNSIAMYEYVLENDVDALNENNFKTNMMIFMFSYAQFIILFVLVIAGSILANEFNKGTIKTLLTSPNSRTKILISKFITIVIMALSVIGIMLVCQFILSIIFYDIRDFNIPVLTYNYSTNELIDEHVLIYLGKQIFAYFPTILILALISLTFTIIISNSAIAIVGTFMVYIFSELANILIVSNDIEWLKWLITLNWDFTSYLYGGENAYEIITLGFSLVVYILYFIIISAIAIIFFKRKNILNE